MALGPNETLTHAKRLQVTLDDLVAQVNAGAGGNGIPPSIIDAKGDLIVGSAVDIPAILSVGTDGQVLSADSTAASGLKWITIQTSSTITKADIGLGNVDNTSDLNKPVSTATQTALNAKADSTALTSHTGNVSNPHSVTKTQVGLGNVDNTSDANKPVSTATQTALNAKADTTYVNNALLGKEDISSRGVPGGYAGLNFSGRVVPAQLGQSPVALTDAATITTDASVSNQFRVTLAGNRTLGNPSNGFDGQMVMWSIKQDATGSRTLTLDTKFRFGSDITSIVLSTTAGKTDKLGAQYNSADDKWDVVSFVRGF